MTVVGVASSKLTHRMSNCADLRRARNDRTADNVYYNSVVRVDIVLLVFSHVRQDGRSCAHALACHRVLSCKRDSAQVGVGLVYYELDSYQQLYSEGSFILRNSFKSPIQNVVNYVFLSTIVVNNCGQQLRGQQLLSTTIVVN